MLVSFGKSSWLSYDTKWCQHLLSPLCVLFHCYWDWCKRRTLTPKHVWDAHISTWSFTQEVCNLFSHLLMFIFLSDLPSGLFHLVKNFFRNFNRLQYGNCSLTVNISTCCAGASMRNGCNWWPLEARAQAWNTFADLCISPLDGFIRCPEELINSYS